MSTMLMNTLWSILADPLAERWALALVHFLWQGLAVAAIYLTLLPLINRRSATAKYAWGLACLATMAVAPLATFALISPLVEPVAEYVAQPLNTTVDVQPAVHDESLRLAEVDISLGAYVTPDETSHMVTAGAALAGTDSMADDWRQILARLQPWILAVWLLGVLLLVARLALGGLLLTRLRATADALPDDWLARAETIRHRLGATRRVVIRTSTRVTEALATGILRPLILIPTCWLTELSPTMLEAVLAHELAHIRRHDLWVNLAQRLLETLLFYHPAVWWLSNRVRRDREKCCDALAVSATGSAAQYAQTLEHLATRRLSGSPSHLLAAGIGEDKMHLLDRVRTILGVNTHSRRTSLWSVGMLLLFLATGGWLASTWTSATIANETSVNETVVADENLDEGHEHEVHDDKDGGEHANRERRDEDSEHAHHDGHDDDSHEHEADEEDVFANDDPQTITAEDDRVVFSNGSGKLRTKSVHLDRSRTAETRGEADLQIQLAELRKIVEQQNHLIEELTKRLGGSEAAQMRIALQAWQRTKAQLSEAPVIQPSAEVQAPKNQELRAKAKYFYLREKLASHKSPKIIERRLAPDGKYELVVIE